MNKKIIKFFLIFFFSILLIFFYLKIFKRDVIVKDKTNTVEDVSNDAGKDNISSSNIIENVKYISKDVNGNEYIINASVGEIDYLNSDIIYLTNINAFIRSVNSENVNISSDFGKYNTTNFDTIFSQNVVITYSDNTIKGEYLDFSIKNNLMIISRNVIYTNLENTLNADVIEVNLDTKNTKIFMHENNKKIKIKSKK